MQQNRQANADGHAAHKECLSNRSAALNMHISIIAGVMVAPAIYQYMIAHVQIHGRLGRSGFRKWQCMHDCKNGPQLDVAVSD